MLEKNLNIPNLNRYLFYFSYIGTRFSGVAKQSNAELTVYNVIDRLIKSLDTKCEIKSNINISSRTDSGVHAISNTATVDLKINETYLNQMSSSLSSKSGSFDSSTDNLNQLVCDDIKNSLNDLFLNNNYLIRINKIKKVQDDFNSRKALSRTYLYRLAFVDKGSSYYKQYEQIELVNRALNDSFRFRVAPPGYYFPLQSFVGSFEREFLTEINEPFDYELFIKAIDLIRGQHNFSAFTTRIGRDELIKKNKNPIKTVEINVNPNGVQFLNNYVNESDERYKIVELEITAESFLYKMIRKMIGTAVNVAQGIMPLKQIEQMMLCPPDFYGPSQITILKPNGLYLKSVNYSTADSSD